MLKSKLHFESEVVDTKDKFIKALNDFSPDVILADHSIPSFDSYEALAALQQSGLKIPFILLTATISDEFAVDVLKKGADDYILKDRLLRLPAAINNALEKNRFEKERQNFLNETIIKEKHYRALIENIHDAIILLNKNAELIYQSPSTEHITGFSLQEAKNRKVCKYIHPNDVGNFLRVFNKVCTNAGSSLSAKYRIRHKKRHYIWIEGTIKNLLHDESVKAIIVNCRDITDRKNAERKLINVNRLYTFISHINQAIVKVKDEQTLFDEACRIAVQQGKFKMAWIGIINKTSRKINVTSSCGTLAQDIEMLTDYTYDIDGPVEKTLQGAAYFVVNNVKNGFAARWKEHALDSGFKSAILLAIKKSGNVYGSLLIYSAETNFFNTEEIDLLKEIANDISFGLNVFETDKQRTLAEQKLEHSELRLKQAQEIAHLGNWELDFSTGVATWSDEHLRIFGLPPGSNKQNYKSWISFIHPDDVDQVIKTTNETKKTFGNSALFHRIIRKDGTVRHLHSQTRVEINKEGEAVGLYGVAHDITEIKEAEAALRESESNLHAIFENTSEGFILTDPEGIVKAFNSKTKDIIFLNTGSEIKIGDSIFMFIHEARKEKYNTAISKVLSGETLQYDYPFERKNGERKWFNFTVNPVYNSGKITAICITSADITERKNAEELLRSSQSNLNAIIENTDSFIYSLDSNLRYVTFNSALQNAMKNLYGVDLVPGYHVFDFIKKHERDRLEEWKENYDKALKGGIVKFEREFTGDGFRSYTSFSLHPMWVNEKVVGLSCFVNDITKEKQDAEEKKNLESLLNTTNKLARIGSWEYNMINKTVYWSDITREIHECDKDVSLDFAESVKCIAPSSRGLMDQVSKNAMEKGVPWDLELKILTVKNNERWIRSIGEAEMVDGKCIRLYGSCQDIDTRKKAEIEVLNVYREKNTILESIRDGFFAVDKNWTVTYWNKEAEKILNTSKDKVVGKILWDVFPGGINSESYKKYNKAVETKEVTVFEDNDKRSNKWYEISAYPSGNGLSVYFKDISERKLAEIEFKRLNRDLEKYARELAFSNKELEQFAYVASHDLQEPLRMVTSFLTLLEQKYANALDDKAKRYIHFAVDGAKRMRQIILDLLEFSKIGKTETTIEDVDLNELINEILLLHDEQIKENNAVINIDKLPVLSTSRTPMRQVFQNLISNSLKYHRDNVDPQIGISIKDEKEYWEFMVADNGRGIGAEFMEKIFVIFQRLDNKDKYSGTGIGLAITKKIIENMNGKIWVESQEGKGSTFHFTIPKHNTIE